MTRTVIDSSAVLAYLLKEPGASRVSKVLGGSLVTTVNLSEIVAKQLQSGTNPETARQELDELGLEVADFTRDLAESAALLVIRTKSLGLSLGDRACLALALREKLPVVTADRAWKNVDLGVEIELIR